MTTKAPATAAEVPDFLMKSVAGFRDSPEFNRLDQELQTVPGLVVGQLTVLLRRLQSEVINQQDVTPPVQETLRDIYRALEVLATSPSLEIQNLVVVEVLEHLHASPEVKKSLLANLGSATRSLYAKWID